MKLTVDPALLDDVAVHERPQPPVEGRTALGIATALASCAHQAGIPTLSTLVAFIADGTIELGDHVTSGMRAELCELGATLSLGCDDWALVNALLRYVEWCGDREGGPSWRRV